MNTVTLCIENCLDCSHCYTDRILTADSFEHEEGAYCRLVKDTSYGSFGQNGKHKLIGSDNWHLRNYTKVPDWYPLLGEQSKARGDA